jgi:hypothetical protein
MTNQATFTYRHAVEAGVSAAAVWSLYEDVATWPLVRITYAAQIEGPEERAKEVGPALTADVPDTMASLVALAKERSR